MPETKLKPLTLLGTFWGQKLDLAETVSAVTNFRLVTASPLKLMYGGNHEFTETRSKCPRMIESSCKSNLLYMSVCVYLAPCGDTRNHSFEFLLHAPLANF